MTAALATTEQMSATYVDRAQAMLRIAALRYSLWEIAATVHRAPREDRDTAIDAYLAVMLDVVLIELDRLDAAGGST